MNIVTISTPDWVDSHLSRWLRYAKKNMPDAKLYLYYVGGKTIAKDFPGLREQFEQVIELPLEGRAQFNRIRMSATTDFGVDSMLYLDADCDIIAPIDAIQLIAEGASLAFVESPAIHRPWSELCLKLKKDVEWSGWVANNGLLWLTEDWGERYDAAVNSVEDSGINPRIIGTIAFNWMLRENYGWARLPAEYGVIWWDSEMFKGAKIIQYCNDKGQGKRVTLEDEWRASRLPDVANPQQARSEG
jgi:hypothetical protein